MIVFGRGTIADFLGDYVVYRNLAPMDERLPGLELVRAEVGLPAGRIPRKVEPDYARVVAAVLRRARELEAPEAQIQRLVFIGDTRMNDGMAFANLCQAGGWAGMAFLGSQDRNPQVTEIVGSGTDRQIYLSNRWAALADFDQFCREHNFPIDTATAVIVDLDKTALGARGRNAHVIDRARVLAVKGTVAALLGKAFDEETFRKAYDRLNQVEFHPFTRDNQDYLAYICLVLGSGLFGLEDVVSEVRAGGLDSFEDFIRQVEVRTEDLPPALADIHAEIYANVQAGDPTPFKAFRQNEYLTTVGKMGFLADDSDAAALLEEEIVITQEVRAAALKWREEGALLFGLSDKPDEASIPTPELQAQGYVAIHHQETHVVGEIEGF